MDRLTVKAARLGMTAQAAVDGGFLDEQGNTLPARPRPKGFTMTNATMLVPVTVQLRNELAATGRVLAAIDKEAGSGRRNSVNDKDHFVQVIESLEPLVIAALGATSSVPLTATSVQPGARFDMGAGTPLAHHVTACVSYLRDTASALLAVGGFSAYTAAGVNVALGMLNGLNGLLLSAIVKQAEADLNHVRSRGIGPLFVAAEALAKGAAGGLREDVENIWDPAR